MSLIQFDRFGSGAPPLTTAPFDPYWEARGLKVALRPGQLNETSQFGARLSVGTGQVVEQSPFGLARRYTGAQGSTLGVQSIAGIDLNKNGPNSSFSVVIAYKSIGNGTLISRATAAGGERLFQIYLDPSFGPTENPGIRLGGVFTGTSFGFRADGLWHIVTVSVAPGVAKAFGDATKEIDLDTSGAWSTGAQNIEIGSRTDTNSFILDGSVAFVYLFDKGITRADHLEIFRNPETVYSRRVWVPRSAAAPSGFKAAWVRRTSQIIGAGAR